MKHRPRLNADVVRAGLERKGLSIKRISEAAGLERSTAWYRLRGATTCPPEFVAWLSEFLDVAATDLVLPEIEPAEPAVSDAAQPRAPGPNFFQRFLLKKRHSKGSTNPPAAESAEKKDI
jgi:transcriptional regulator with XRE-family HTH domain